MRKNRWRRNDVEGLRAVLRTERWVTRRDTTTTRLWSEILPRSEVEKSGGVQATSGSWLNPGMPENSPAIHCWGKSSALVLVAEGRLTPIRSRGPGILHPSLRDFGDGPSSSSPSNKSPGYYRPSLREDKKSSATSRRSPRTPSSRCCPCIPSRCESRSSTCSTRQPYATLSP